MFLINMNSINIIQNLYIFLSTGPTTQEISQKGKEDGMWASLHRHYMCMLWTLSDLEKKAQSKSANNPLSDLDCSAYNADIHLIEQQKNL